MEVIVFAFILAIFLLPLVPERYDWIDTVLALFKLWLCFAFIIGTILLMLGYGR